MWERESAARAAGLAQEGEFAPAGAAERIHRLDLLAAAKAARRQDEIKERATGAFESTRYVREHASRMGPRPRAAVNKQAGHCAHGHPRLIWRHGRRRDPCLRSPGGAA